MICSVCHVITDLICDINLDMATNLSTLVVSRDQLTSGMFSLLPISRDMAEESIVL